MKFSMIGQEKGNLLKQVTAWAGLTVVHLFKSLRKFCHRVSHCYRFSHFNLFI